MLSILKFEVKGVPWGWDQVEHPGLRIDSRQIHVFQTTPIHHEFRLSFVGREWDVWVSGRGARWWFAVCAVCSQQECLSMVMHRISPQVNLQRCCVAKSSQRTLTQHPVHEIGFSIVASHRTYFLPSVGPGMARAGGRSERASGVM